MPAALQPASTIDELLYEAVQITRPMMRHVTAAMEAGLAGTGISAGMRAILEVVHRNGPMTVPEMTVRLQLKRQFVHKVAADAVAAGLLETVPNPSHRRAHFFAVSAKGSAAIVRIRDQETRWLRDFARQFPKEDIEAHARIQKALSLFFAGVAAGEQHTDEFGEVSPSA
jgi:DNA-binding MarR family transcriptional regulator